MKANKKKNPKWNLSPWSPPKCKKWIYKHAPPPFYLEEQKLITRHPQTPRQSHRNPRCNLCQLVLPSVSSPCLSPPTICHPRNSSPFVLSLLLKLLSLLSRRCANPRPTTGYSSLEHPACVPYTCCKDVDALLASCQLLIL